jgi:ATP-dependent Lon protease
MAPTKIDKFTKKSTLRNEKKQKLRRNKQDSDSDSEDFELEEDEEDEYETVSESDSTYTPPEKTKSKKSKKRVIESDSEEEEEDEEFDRKKFRKTLSKIFPSKYISKKVKDDEEESEEEEPPRRKSSKSKKRNTKRDESEEEESEEEAPRRKSSKSKKRSSKRDESESEEEESEEEEAPRKKNSRKYDLRKHRMVNVDSDSESSEEDDEEDDDKKYSIVFTIGGNDEYGDDYNEEYEDDEEEEPPKEEEYNSDDEKTFMKENYEEIAIPKEAQKKSKSKKSKKEKKEVEPALEQDIENEYVELKELRKILIEKLQKKPNSKILKNAIEECKKSIRELIVSARKNNTKKYYKLIHGERKKTSEFDYFKKNFSNKQQLDIVKEMAEVNEHINIEKPYRLALLQSHIPANYKATAMQKLNMLKSMEPGDSEYYKIKSWVDTFMKIPFGVNKSLSVNMSDGIDKCHDFMGNAKKILDDCVYGLDDAKIQIMQMVGQWIANPSAMGTAIAIHGPPGSGKTSLVKDGISKILGREFAFIALGGASDASFLEGHSYTYEGSTWGKIVQILINSKCMNPVIYFDELDKISDTAKGEEIIGILTHLTDTSQNSQFHDKYFTEVEFDLSKCLFIFSYNDESKVNPILKDRMYRIQTKGYDAKQKVIIARNYMLPKIREQVNFTEEEVIIPDETINYIASSQSLTKGESGVRNLKRCLEIIYTKLNLFRLMKPGNNIFEKDMDIKVEFPFTVTKKEVDIFIKNEENQNQSLLAMYC